MSLVVSSASQVRAKMIKTILDTQTGLHWLPIEATEFMTINEVLLGTRPGGSFDGFRFATKAEIEKLFLNAFGVSNGSFPYANGHTFFKLFGYDLGGLYPEDQSPGLHDAYLAAPFDAGLADLSQPLGPKDIVGSAQVEIHYFNSGTGQDESSGICRIGQATASAYDTQDPEVSHGWLVWRR